MMRRDRLYMAVCDDEPEDVERIQKTMQKVMERLEYQEAFEFRSFTKGSELYEAAVREPFSLVFLDIEMPKMNGFQLASKLCADVPGIRLIFISRYEHFAFDAYEYAPFWFIRKSELEYDMYRAMYRYKQFVLDSMLTYKVKDEMGFKEIYIKDILYIESVEHTLLFRTVQGLCLKKYGSLKEVEKELASCGFLRIHKSCLANQRHIKQVEKQDVLFDGGIRMALGRDRRKSIKEAMLQYRKE